MAHDEHCFFFLRRLIPPKTKEIIPFSKLIKRFIKTLHIMAINTSLFVTSHNM